MHVANGVFTAGEAVKTRMRPEGPGWKQLWTSRPCLVEPDAPGALKASQDQAKGRKNSSEKMVLKPKMA